MVAPRAMQSAKITTEAGYTWWRCPSYTRHLGEIIEERVVIAGRDPQISIRLGREPE